MPSVRCRRHCQQASRKSSADISPAASRAAVRRSLVSRIATRCGVNAASPAPSGSKGNRFVVYLDRSWLLPEPPADRRVRRFQRVVQPDRHVRILQPFFRERGQLNPRPRNTARYRRPGFSTRRGRSGVQAPIVRRCSRFDSDTRCTSKGEAGSVASARAERSLMPPIMLVCRSVSTSVRSWYSTLAVTASTGAITGNGVETSSGAKNLVHYLAAGSQVHYGSKTSKVDGAANANGALGRVRRAAYRAPDVSFHKWRCCGES